MVSVETTVENQPIRQITKKPAPPKKSPRSQLEISSSELTKVSPYSISPSPSHHHHHTEMSHRTSVHVKSSSSSSLSSSSSASSSITNITSRAVSPKIDSDRFDNEIFESDEILRILFKKKCFYQMKLR
jgi:hypothetical protein